MNNLPIQYLPQEAEFSQLQIIAHTAMQSAAYKVHGSEANIFVILLAARELGIPPMQALNGGIWNIQGRVEISARLMSSMIRRAGHSIKILSCNDKECILEGKRKDNGDSFSAKFTIEDANRAGLIKPNGVWTKYAEDMLYARALSRLARRLYADVIGTAYVEGEIREEKLEMSDAVVVEEEQTKEEAPPPPPLIKMITQEQLQEMEQVIPLCSPAFNKKIQDYLAKCQLKSFNELSQKMFNDIMIQAVPEMHAYQASIAVEELIAI